MAFPREVEMIGAGTYVAVVEITVLVIVANTIVGLWTVMARTVGETLVRVGLGTLTVQHLIVGTRS